MNSSPYYCGKCLINWSLFELIIIFMYFRHKILQKLRKSFFIQYFRIEFICCNNFLFCFSSEYISHIFHTKLTPNCLTFEMHLTFEAMICVLRVEKSVLQLRLKCWESFWSQKKLFFSCKHFPSKK